MHKIRAFFPEIGEIVSKKKKEKRRETSPLPPSCTPVSVAEYASISLNIPKYP